MYKRILVPVDGSPTATRALTAALRMARETLGQVRVLHVLDDLPYASGMDYAGNVLQLMREEAQRVLAVAQAQAESAGVPAETALEEQTGRRLGDVVAQAAAAWKADLVVVGSHGRRGVARVLLGSGAEQIIRTAAVPVLVIRGTDAD